MKEKWLDTKELAEMLGLHEATLAGWRLEGRGPAFVKVGRRVRYRWEDIEEWAESHKKERTG